MKILIIKIKGDCFANIINFLVDNLSDLFLGIRQQLGTGGRKEGNIGSKERSIKYTFYDDTKRTERAV